MAFQRKKPMAIGVKARFPGFVEPALATSIEKVPSGDRWIHEIKFHGYRVQVHLVNEAVKVFTRRGNDETVYLVADDFGRLGRAWREADYEATDLETVIQDLLTGQYSQPIRVIAFNTAERWSEDVSEDVARELRRRCDLQMRDLPFAISDFVERHEDRDRRQLTLRLV